MKLKLNLVSTYRAPIYGLAILWVVFYHAYGINDCDYSFGLSSLGWFQEMMRRGNVGVDVFLFLSGISLYFSFVKNSDYHQFIVKRLKRVAIPTLLIYTIYWSIKYLVLDFAPVGWFSRMTLMRFWMTGDSSIWFISLILVLYFLYPYIYAFMFRGKHPNVKFLILILMTYATIYAISIVAPDTCDMLEIALGRIPVFIIGAWFGKFVYEKKEVNIVWAILVPLGVALFFYVMQADLIHGIQRRFFYAIGGISICYLMAFIFAGFAKLGKFGSAINGFFGFFGGFSLELYCAHIMLNQVLRMFSFYEVGSFSQYFAMAALAVILAFAVSKLYNALNSWSAKRKLKRAEKDSALSA